MEMMVEVTYYGGELFGHLLDKEYNMPMYKRLDKVLGCCENDIFPIIFMIRSKLPIEIYSVLS